MTEPRGQGLLWPGVLAGIGLAGTLDEVVLHQLLGWHHFSTTLLVIGVIQLVERRRTSPDPPGLALAGILLGAGGFNLYDGTIQHKLLGLHQVRANAPNNLPYDLTFLAIAAVVFAAGLVLLRRTRQP